MKSTKFQTFAWKFCIFETIIYQYDCSQRFFFQKYRDNLNKHPTQVFAFAYGVKTKVTTREVIFKEKKSAKL